MRRPWGRHTLVALVVACAAALGIVALSLDAAGLRGDREAGAAPAPRLGGTSGDLYPPDSPWNTPVPTDAEIDPRSGELVGSLVEAGDDRGFVLALREWTVPVYFADRQTPRRDVSLTAPWAPYSALTDVPIPDGARPDPQDDAHLTVIDRSSGCEFDLWQASRDAAGRWSASWGNAVRLRERGVYPDGLSARGSGFASAAGLLWPEEIESGRIDHALVFSYPTVKGGGPVAPATSSDGESGRDDALPEGARVRLDPDLDVSTLELGPEEEVIARALQEYGMFLGDRGGAMAIYAAHPYGFEDDPWTSASDGAFMELSGIPLDRLQVLKLGPQEPEPRTPAGGGGCATFSR